jgi:uncharacterized integral membrane protein
VSRLVGASGVLLVLVLSIGFASLNSGQRVTLRLGFTTIYGLSLTAVAFGSLVVGMIIMLVAGIQSDLKVRRILRARLIEEDIAERSLFVDQAQHDLFEEAPEEAAEEGSVRRKG